MKKISAILVAMLVMLTALAQSPEKISYQAVVRNNNNALVANQHISMKVSILQGSVDGTPIYVETHVRPTNANGLVSIEIGDGVAVSGTFSIINWAEGPYFFKTEIDPTGGTDYTITGTSQLLSVPYALHAKTAEQVSGPININEADPVYSSSQAVNITSADIDNLSNLSGINTGDQDLSGYATLSDLEDAETAIREDIPSGYITDEMDPVFSSSAAAQIASPDIEAWNAASAWDKDYADLSNKPTTITTEQAAAITSNTSKLSGIEEGAEVNVKADWNATSGDAQILNKPDMNDYAQATNVLTKNNTVPFTPDGDYEPATKKYVDEHIGERYIGEIYGGGIIFWLTPDKQHGLIASLADLNKDTTGVAWGPEQWFHARNATDGAENTAKESSGPDSAIYLCKHYKAGNYTDWYLPSIRELVLLASKDILIDYILDNDGDPETQGFHQEYDNSVQGRYWSSTEHVTEKAWGYNFLYHEKFSYGKYNNYYVRAIRAF